MKHLYFVHIPLEMKEISSDLIKHYDNIKIALYRRK